MALANLLRTFRVGLVLGWMKLVNGTSGSTLIES
jgi:hypothetical protein